MEEVYLLIGISQSIKNISLSFFIVECIMLLLSSILAHFLQCQYLCYIRSTVCSMFAFYFCLLKENLVFKWIHVFALCIKIIQYSNGHDWYGIKTFFKMFKEKEKNSSYIDVNKMLHSCRTELAKQMVCSWAIEQKLWIWMIIVISPSFRISF